MRNGISNLRVSKIVVYIPYLALAWTTPPGAGNANFEIVATERGGGSAADDADDNACGGGGGSAADDADDADDNACGGGGGSAADDADDDGDNACGGGGGSAADDADDDDDNAGGGGGIFDIDITMLLYHYTLFIRYNRSTLHNNASPGAKNHLRPFTRLASNARNKNS